MRLTAPYAVFAAAILVAESVFEFGRIVFDRPWPGTYPIGPHSDTISAVLAALWLSAAALLLLKAKRPRLEPAAWIVAIAANLALFIHGVIARVFGAPGALVNVFVALVLAGLLTRALGPWRQRYVHEPADRPVA